MKPFKRDHGWQHYLSAGDCERRLEDRVGLSEGATLPQATDASYRVSYEGERAPATRELGLDNVGVKNERGWIKVDDRMRTNDPDVYAVGDVTGGPLLAHVASAEGVVAAENIMGCDSRIDLGFVPSCVYTSPELAWVGMTEPEAKQRFGEVRVGKLPLEASGKALAMGKARGFVKVLGDAKYGQILGVHMVGANVTEMIAGAVTAMRLEATTDFLGSIIFPHPTISEAIMEAAKLAAGTSPYVRSLA
ncbi:MAG TPA: FAD-dependent oxidoreductase [Firmicutes bacterium]|nr:FAD-dependent oxidoreductase [Bacillota bacterium]